MVMDLPDSFPSQTEQVAHEMKCKSYIKRDTRPLQDFVREIIMSKGTLGWRHQGLTKRVTCDCLLSVGTAERGSKWQEWKTKIQTEKEGRRIDYIRVCVPYECVC